MGNQHTPAPWTLQEHEHEPCQLIGNGTIHIADIYMTDFPAGKADSLLIAAAPELLQTLKDIQRNAQVMNQAEPNRVWSAIDDAAGAAIAKAVQS